MLDPKLLRTDINQVAQKLAPRGFVLNVDEISTLENKRKQIQVKVQNLQNERNRISRQIGKAKAQGEDIEPVLKQVEIIKTNLLKIERELDTIQDKLKLELAKIPNIPHESVPVGNSEDDNVEIRKYGEPRKFEFSVKDHVKIGQNLGGIDFEAASKLTGSRFAVMHGAIAGLHRALIRFMLEIHTKEHDYQETYVPYMVNADSLFGTGQLPKFKQEQYALRAEDTLSDDNGTREYFLIPTAEVPVTNLYRDEIVDIKDLPIKHVCHTPCFRSEAGSYGRDTKGLIRQHQFEKIELVQLVKPEDSYQALEKLTRDAEKILQLLKLPYKVVSLCSGDLGFSAAKTYDLEVWIPSQNTYREISSCSNFEDFQARRMQARFRNPATCKPELLHTLNGSGLAVGRTLVAILENYQNQDGSVSIPEALQDFTGFDRIG